MYSSERCADYDYREDCAAARPFRDCTGNVARRQDCLILLVPDAGRWSRRLAAWRWIMSLAAQIRQQRRDALLSTLHPRTLCLLFAAFHSSLTGCAVRDYSPPLLPPFMPEQTPARVA